MKITKLETDMLRNIAENNFTNVNGAVPKSLDDVSWIWSHSIVNDGPIHINSRSIPGVMSSLVKKGLALSDGEHVSLTPAGFAAYQEKWPS